MRDHTFNKRALLPSQARANYWVPGYASLSRLNSDSIHLGGESRMDPNYCARVNTALGCTLCMDNVYMYVQYPSDTRYSTDQRQGILRLRFDRGSASYEPQSK